MKRDGMNQMIRRGFLLSAMAGIGLSVALSTAAFAGHREFVIDDPSKRDVVRFDSDAPVELITGTTNKVKGTIKYDDTFAFDAKHPFDITFNVDLASIDTGIPLRNEHMRDNFLETAKFPKATFHVKKIQTTSKPPFKNGQVVTLKATGDFTLHGKTVSKTVPLKVTYFPESNTTHQRFKSGNMIRIQGKFPVTLTEHNIKRPEAVFVKLAETVFVTLDVFGTDDPQAVK